MKILYGILCVLMLLTGCDMLRGEMENIDTFTLPVPNTANGKKLKLWATWYYLPRYEHVEDGIPLRNLDGEDLGVHLETQEWCDIAMEGSAIIEKDGIATTYNYAGSNFDYLVDCSPWYDYAPLGKTKFREANGPFGDGVEDYILRPYRTIATDASIVPWGSVVYIPAARGLTFIDADGVEITHDGYFFAGDSGGLILKNHIDVFIGISTESPFDWISNTSDKTFTAYILNDPLLVKDFKRYHTL